MTVKVEKIETVVTEQGTGERTEVTYALGADIDGVFIPFLTKSGPYVDHLVEAAKAAAEAEKAKPKSKPSEA
jgi:hypothetical protein